MKNLINEAILPMINSGLMSLYRIEELVYIKEFIDRNTSKKYLEPADVDRIKEKYGVLPNVITWGDYFQTEMATALRDKSDEEFMRAVNTVKFDIISSNMIFSSKPSEFLEWVDKRYFDLLVNDKNDFSDEEKEIIHLKIMKDYFTDMNVVDNFSQSEMKWYLSFEEAAAI
jgi:hypothetical protein